MKLKKSCELGKCESKFIDSCSSDSNFWRGNRGNVFNLLSQIASGKFVMVGKGENKKSMAYISNIVAFLETCITTDQKYGLYNYVDTPDLTMNELVSQVREMLKEKPSWSTVTLLVGNNSWIQRRFSR